jgi:hypothetical protein
MLSALGWGTPNASWMRPSVAVLLWPMSAITLAVGLLIFMAFIGLGWLLTVLVDAPALRLLASIRALEKKWRSPVAAVEAIR